MKGLRLALVVLTMFLAFGVASVYGGNGGGTGEGQVGMPILSTTGLPALSGSLFSGALRVIYADGTPVVLSTDKVNLNLCNTSCVTVTANLTQTAPGTYTYTFTPPSSLTGTVTIYIQGYGLADDNGRMFPSIDTAIATYAYAPSTTTGTSAPIGTTSAPPAGTPVSPITRQAVNTVQTPTQTFPTGELLAVLSVLGLAGCLLVLPSRGSVK